MYFLQFLTRSNKNLLILSGLIGVLSGGANAFLLAIISDNLSSLESTAETADGWMYALAAAAFLITGFGSQFMLVHLSQGINFNLRKNLYNQIMAMPYARFEERGSARFMTAFTQDIPAVSSALMEFPALVINGSMTLGCMVFLGYLSLPTLVFLLLFLVFALITYLIPERFAIRFLERTRESWDKTVSYFSAMNDGAIELRLHRDRRKAFLDENLLNATADIRKHGYRHRVIYVFLGNWIKMIYFVFIGLLIFILPTYQEIDEKAIFGFSIISLYIMGPIQMIVSALPRFRTANVAYRKMEQLGLIMDTRKKEAPHESEVAPTGRSILPPFESISLEQVSYSFRRWDDDTPFRLGPVDFSMRSGEVVFLVGGNGSGKTTLAKVFCGLYTPEEGRLSYNGHDIIEADLEEYRQNFSAIFNNFFVFEQILGLEPDVVTEHAQTYLEKLRLDHKVDIVDGELSTTKLSAGQRKRLALLTVYLEDRPICVFDEWAADQDPEFKQVFYLELLPELKARGKCILVISHDDRYFGIADRIVKMVNGKIEEVSSPQQLRSAETTSLRA